MSVSWTDTPGSTLPSTTEPLDFTVTEPVVAISVSFGSTRTEERAWRDGVFLWPYLRSSRNGNTFSLVRDDGTPGWPGNPQPFIDEIGSSLQPLNYSANIVAAYALNEPAAACNTDRSGNGKDFVTSRLASDMANAPDLVPGKACIWSPGPYAAAPIQCRQTDNVWGMFGEVTVAHRVFISDPENTTEHCFGQMQGTPPGTASVAFQWGIVGNGATPACLYYYAETAAKAGITFISTLQVLSNAWYWVTARRRSDNTVRLGIGTGPNAAQQTYQDSGALGTPGTAVANPRYLALCAHQDDTVPIRGGMADLIVWNRFLTDAELVPQYTAAMRALGVT